jgi:hypothetical protein
VHKTIGNLLPTTVTGYNRSLLFNFVNYIQTADERRFVAPHMRLSPLCPPLCNIHVLRINTCVSSRGATLVDALCQGATRSVHLWLIVHIYYRNGLYCTNPYYFGSPSPTGSGLVLMPFSKPVPDPL